jgi:hypothetical protein
LVFGYAHQADTFKSNKKAPKTYAKTTLCARYSLAFSLISAMDNEDLNQSKK